MGKVILFGEPMALLIADRTGKLENIDHFTRSLSGAEVNVSIGLSRLGHTVSYLTRLGEDPFGHYIENKLNEDQIGTEWVTYDDVYKTGIQLKNRVDDGSDPYAPYYRKGSAASHISKDEIDKIDFSDIDLVHITGIPPALSESAKQATYRLVERAKEAGIYVSFDPNLRPALWPSQEEMVKTINDLASHADMVLPGIGECEILAGTSDLKEAADFYQNLGVTTVIIKNGSKGAYVRDGSTSQMISGFKVDKVVDTVGAGDGFAVGIISGKLEGLSLYDMVKRGTAIGAIQVTNISDNAGLPTPEELDSFMTSQAGA